MIFTGEKQQRIKTRAIIDKIHWTNVATHYRNKDHYDTILAMAAENIVRSLEVIARRIDNA